MVHYGALMTDGAFGESALSNGGSAVKCLGLDAGDGDVEKVAGDDGAGVGEMDDFVGGGAASPT